MQNKISPRIFDILTGQEHHLDLDSHLTEVPLMPLQAASCIYGGCQSYLSRLQQRQRLYFYTVVAKFGPPVDRCLRKDDALDQKGEHKLPDILALQQLR